MTHVYSIAEPIDTYRNVPHISITNRENGFPLYTTGLYIHTSMEVVGSRFAEVTKCSFCLTIAVDTSIYPDSLAKVSIFNQKLSVLTT